MRGFKRAVVKVIILVSLAILFSLIAVTPGGLVSNTPATRVGVHSIIAFWISIPVALSVLAFLKRQSKAGLLLVSAMIFPMVLHIGSAAMNILRIDEPTVIHLINDSVADLLELVILSFLLVGACIGFAKNSNSSDIQSPSLLLIPILLILPPAIFGGIWILLLFLELEFIIDISSIFVLIAISGFIISALVVPRFRESAPPIDSGFFISSILLFSLSGIAILLTLTQPDVSWKLAENMQMGAHLLFALAMGIPFLKRAGFQRSFTYAIILGLIFLAYLPFLITIVIESASTIPSSGPTDLLAYIIIHVGAASLAAIMAILLYIYPRKKLTWNHYPLIVLFGMWCGITIFQVLLLLFPSVAPLGEPITPNNIGSILTLVLLYITVRWTMDPPIGRREIPSLFDLSLIIAGLMFLVVSGEGINQLVLIFNPILSGNPASNVLILVTNLFIMFAFAYIIFLLSKDSKGEAPVELYVVLFLAMWILPNILKSYYELWTTGWWISEILLFAGLLAGPPLFTWLYVRTMHEAEESHKRANMYADLLMHDVSNYNQMMMISLELLGSQDIPEPARKRVADDGRQVISLSEQLISNVRLLSQADQLKTSDLQPINLVTTIVSAIDVFTRRIGSGELKLEFQFEDAEIYIMGNELLMHIVLNILYSALECRIRGEKVNITVQETEQSGDVFWQINIQAPGRKPDQKDEYSSSTLGLLAAQLMTESLNGLFAVQTFERNDECEGRLFSIMLHMAKVE
ncbi:MAG: hypothetical protein AM326_05120 [Candidatus Thorarchaeota archaeon SMTZ-45]|nr:MAG: hypothetical protein AM325_16360 [Candidatus Thorarchaeota archaeon SMTZ1-45]KXH77412.1 MAG: hypothetical protein AM326_05120 [Candidatus Thorarchaeota archaeon SMTZ-45]